MSTISAAIYELFQTWKIPREIFQVLKPCVSRSGVCKVLKSLMETGSALPKVRSTPRQKLRTQNLIKNTQEEIRTNLKRSIRKLASEANVSYGTMQTALKIDLNLSPLIIIIIIIIMVIFKCYFSGELIALS